MGTLEFCFLVSQSAGDKEAGGGRGQGSWRDGPFTCGVTALLGPHVRTACPEAGVAKLLPLENLHVCVQVKRRHHSASFYSHVLETPNPSPETQGRSEAAWRSGLTGRLTKARGAIRGDGVQLTSGLCWWFSWPCAQVRFIRRYISTHPLLLVSYTQYNCLKLDPWGWMRCRARIQIGRCLEMYSLGLT